MTVYWLIFAYAAVMALLYPAREGTGRLGPAQVLAFAFFIAVYSLVAALREKIGGDWLSYEQIFDVLSSGSLEEAVSSPSIEPLFGALVWISGQLGLGIYLPNGICAFLIAYGVVRASSTFRDPWLAVVLAIPYLLIVVGMGYVRQGAAIGLILLAIASVQRNRPVLVIAQLAMAAGFHTSSAVVFPLFGYALANKNRFVALLLTAVSVAALIFVLAPRVSAYQTNYIGNEYDSSGTLARLLIALVPSLLFLLRRKMGAPVDRSRSIWMGMALANCVAMVAFALSPSSTAVDRLALYTSVVQLPAAGNFALLSGLSSRNIFVQRLAVIAAASAVQAVWLVFSTYADLWVPYSWVLGAP